jgi:excisionase family DNA binding protein
MENQILFSISLDEFEALQKNWIKDVLNEVNQNEASVKSELPELLTRKLTAKYLGISLVSLYHWTKEGKLQSYKISGRIRYKRDEILKAIREVKNLKYKRVR